jgi:hypothetical protein
MSESVAAVATEALSGGQRALVNDCSPASGITTMVTSSAGGDVLTATEPVDNEAALLSAIVPHVMMSLPVVKSSRSSGQTVIVDGRTRLAVADSR